MNCPFTKKKIKKSRISVTTDTDQENAYLSLSPSVTSYKRLAPPSAQALKRALKRKNKNYSTQEAENNVFHMINIRKMTLRHTYHHTDLPESFHLQLTTLLVLNMTPQSPRWASQNHLETKSISFCLCQSFRFSKGEDCL